MVLLLAAALASTPVEVEISSVDRHSVTLGRRGERIRETWTVRVAGKTATVSFDAYHTRMAGTPRFHSAGDQVSLSVDSSQRKALEEGGVARLPISAVRD